ncbi:hypothetical protein CONPUDRAFT_146148 [Coniophora puteana RWD-64-598 SS2]|uniref:Uncharacterized protein n=1 Tax=Coniophora puteana (strain RWD-64-598) TaxID=741705 RepID=A0A5M3MDH6_CONPW|nr:uncharacterized protein CONPUDRAFT_146148 [Coniophora puteana RWD-64-598 SS2]EIW77036.1 hypothetical protein CONPUDRAFT_146148 [Coniophora puteana RWD-64-598 SS2]
MHPRRSILPVLSPARDALGSGIIVVFVAARELRQVSGSDCKKGNPVATANKQIAIGFPSKVELLILQVAAWRVLRMFQRNRCCRGTYDKLSNVLQRWIQEQLQRGGAFFCIRHVHNTRASTPSVARPDLALLSGFSGSALNLGLQLSTVFAQHLCVRDETTFVGDQEVPSGRAGKPYRDLKAYSTELRRPTRRLPGASAPIDKDTFDLASSSQIGLTPHEP